MNILIGFMAGLLIGDAIVVLSELIPRASTSFPKTAPSFRDALRPGSSSRWIRFHVVVIGLSGLVAALLAATVTPRDALITGGSAALFGLIALIDLKYRLVPNLITYPALVIVIGAQLLLHTIEPRSLLLGLGFAACIFGLTAWIKPGSLGGGDVKLAIVMGGLFGFPNILIALLIGVGSGAAAAILHLWGKGKNAKMAYAPYLCLGAFAVLILRL